MKVFSASRFSYAQLLIITSLVSTAWALYGLSLFLLLVMLTSISLAIYARSLSFVLDDGNLVLTRCGKRISSYDIDKCKLITFHNKSFSLVLNDGKWLWSLHIIDNSHALMSEIFKNRREQLGTAENNLFLLFKKSGYIFYALLGVILISLPCIQYNDAPNNKSDLVKKHGTIVSINLDNVLKLRFKEYDTDFLITQRMGDVWEYYSVLETIENKRVSFFIYGADKINEYGADKINEKDQIKIWAIYNDKGAIIDLDNTLNSWIDWKRWGAIALSGILFLIFSLNRYRNVGEFN